MKAVIRGFETIDYVKKDTGTKVQGVSLYLTCPDSNVIGEKIKEEYISAGTPIYNVIAPYLSGEKDMDQLIGAKVFIDYDVSKRGNYNRVSIIDMSIEPNELVRKEVSA